MVKIKSSQTREALRWKIEGIKDKFLDGLEPMGVGQLRGHSLKNTK